LDPSSDCPLSTSRDESLPSSIRPTFKDAPWAAIAAYCREQAAASRWIGPAPPRPTYFSCGDPCPSLPEVAAETDDEPLSCQYHVGPSPSCPECVPGVFVCLTHFVACKAQGGLVCPFCKRVLCMNHHTCFCAERDEAKQKWNASSLQECAQNVLQRNKGINRASFTAFSRVLSERHQTEKLYILAPSPPPPLT